MSKELMHIFHPQEIEPITGLSAVGDFRNSVPNLVKRALSLRNVKKMESLWTRHFLEKGGLVENELARYDLSADSGHAVFSVDECEQKDTGDILNILKFIFGGNLQNVYIYADFKKNNDRVNQASLYFLSIEDGDDSIRNLLKVEYKNQTLTVKQVLNGQVTSIKDWRKELWCSQATALAFQSLNTTLSQQLTQYQIQAVNFQKNNLLH